MENSVSPPFRQIHYGGRDFHYRSEFPEQRLLSILSKIRFSESGCWEWLGSKNSMGYGVVHFDDRKQLAHRLSWLAFVGDLKIRPDPISTNYESLHHKCENKGCLNPSHLEKIGFQEHGRITSTGPAAENRRKTHCKRGHLLSVENTRAWVRRTGVVSRTCKTCEKQQAQERFKRQYVPHPRQPRTHCCSGHELTPENTYTYRGERQCRECHRRHSHTYNQKRLAKKRESKQFELTQPPS